MFQRKKRNKESERERKELEKKKLKETDEWMSEIQRLNDLNEDLTVDNGNLAERCRKLEAISDTLKVLLLSLIPPNADYEKIYMELADIYDPEGFCLHNVAKKMTNIDVCSYFATEDNLGYFEAADGYELLGWIIKAKFGEIEWRQLNPPYEIAESVSLNGRDKEIEYFYKKLYKETVLKLLK